MKVLKLKALLVDVNPAKRSRSHDRGSEVSRKITCALISWNAVSETCTTLSCSRLVGERGDLGNLGGNQQRKAGRGDESKGPD
jgi:hypothetical protein